MKTPEEYNERYFMDDNLDLVDLIGEIQKEARDEGIEFAQRWIPVEEELPEEGSEVLTKTSDDWFRIMTFGSVGYKRFPSQVTHWRPITIK